MNYYADRTRALSGSITRANVYGFMRLRGVPLRTGRKTIVDAKMGLDIVLFLILAWKVSERED